MPVNFDEYKELEPKDLALERSELSVNRGLAIYEEIDGEIFFETREPKNLPNSPMDELKVLNMETQWGRFDVLSRRYYGTVRLWWIFPDANEIPDIFDIPKGEAVIIPAKEIIYGRAVNV